MFTQNLGLEFFDPKKIKSKTHKRQVYHWCRFHFMFDFDKTNMSGPKLSPFCICWLDAAPKIVKHMKVKNVNSVRNCKKCYVNRGMLSWSALWGPKCHSALLLMHFCFEWLIFISTKNCFSGHVFFPVFTCFNLA